MHSGQQSDKDFFSRLVLQGLGTACTFFNSKARVINPFLPPNVKTIIHWINVTDPQGLRQRVGEHTCSAIVPLH